MVKKSKLDWEVQKECIDIEEYELTVEKEKVSWECEQGRESWKWIVSYHGSIVSSGSANSQEEAKEHAIQNLPKDLDNVDDDDCGCDD